MKHDARGDIRREILITQYMDLCNILYVTHNVYGRTE